MPEQTPKLLFVCIENSNRSQLAKGFARTRGRGALTAFSAGSRPSGQVNPRAIQFMKEKGIDLTAQMSKGLDDLPNRHFPDDGFRAIRDRIEELIGALLSGALATPKPDTESPP